MKYIIHQYYVFKVLIYELDQVFIGNVRKNFL